MQSKDTIISAYNQVLDYYDNIKHLATEEEINSVFKHRKDNDFIVMYASPWDEWSVRAIEMAAKSLEEDDLKVLYVIDSWDTPEAFATFSITAAPALLISKDGKVSVVSDYPGIYTYFNVSKSVRERVN